MEYRIIKKTKITDSGNEVSTYHIKKKFLFFWRYLATKDTSEIVGAILSANLIYISITLLGYMITNSFSYIPHLVCLPILNIVTYFLAITGYKDSYVFKEQAEQELTNIIKKKYYVANEEIVSSIKLEKGNLTIEK